MFYNTETRPRYAGDIARCCSNRVCPSIRHVRRPTFAGKENTAWYVVATQIGWTFAFAYEVIPLSLAFILMIWICLIGLLYMQYHTESDGNLLEFWVLRFPFSVHAGWITAASALNANVQVVSMVPSPPCRRQHPSNPIVA